MNFEKTTSETYVLTHLARPIDQQTELLYELLKHYKKGLNRREIMNKCWILNAPDVIMRLRRKGLTILNRTMKLKNKYNRTITYDYYVVQDFAKGVDLYNKLNPKTS